MMKKKQIFQFWHDLGITAKFSLAFGVLLVLMFFVTAVSFAILTVVQRETDAAIINTNAIQRQVLDLDRNLEKARRLEKQFFLSYPTLGYAAAYEKYAIPATEQIAQIVGINTELKRLLQESEMVDIWQENDVNLNMYFLSVNRHAISVAEVTQLIAQLAAGDTGILVQMHSSSASLLEVIQQANDPNLILLYREMQSFEKDYLNTRQRPLMQSAFNSSVHLREAIENTPTLNEDQKAQALNHLDRYLETAAKVIDINAAIESKFNEFDLQAEAIDPVIDELIYLAGQEVERAQERIRQLGQIADLALTATALLGLGSVFVISLVLRNSITANIIELTDATNKFRAGNYDARAQLDSRDEIGQLAVSFNSMASQLGTLVGNLEQQVAERTRELSSVNLKLREDIIERKQAEAQLRESEALLREAQHIAHIAHWTFDPATGMLWWSDELYRIYDRDPADGPLPYEEYPQLVHPDDWEWFDTTFQATAENGTPFDIILRIMRPDGSERIINSKCQPLTDDTGAVVEIRGTIQDVTELKQAEAEIRKHRDQLEELVAARTAELNDRVAEVEELNNAMMNIMEDVQTTNKNLARTTARLQYANKELESFSYSISHDLRALLRHVDGFLLMLHEREAGRLDATSERYLNNVSEATALMGNLIDDLLKILPDFTGRYGLD